ncbi:MAG: D-alanyl-D-alanine carboxypeptidase [Bacteroidetes bacterium]|nr:D-alanyl-D-alanine carboxypeptidase [Bacteroidota bacterium]
MKGKVLIIACFAAFFLTLTNIAQAGHITRHQIKKLFKHSLIVKDHFTGFALYDMDEKYMVYELNSGKYFTPASNTKLFTFYTCLRMLGDSIPAFKYVIHGDSLIFWGTGDPSFLQTGLKATNGFNFLENSGKKLYWSSGLYQNDMFGSGWAWNDYNDYYQAEINEFPIEDNVAVLSAGKDGKLQISPAILSMYLKCDSSYKPTRFRVTRDMLSNTFIYPAMPVPANFHQEIPWKVSTTLTASLLQDTLKKPVIEVHLPLPADAKVVYDDNADTVYRHMLQPSDNFIAEQLLLVCSSAKFGVLNTDSVINYSKKNFLNDLPDEPQWADGSGLSRFNLFTPRSIVTLLCKISNQMKNDSLLHSLMPAGGVIGTIRSAYKTDNGQPFVWAKTGTLMNVHNESGYIVTRKGRHLAFSFMNNNFTRPSREIRDEMVRIITYIHDNY